MKSFIKTTVLWGALLCVVLLCASCENFLSGSKVKDDLEKAILIANSECPVATVEEPAFSDTGVARNKTIVISFTMPMDPQTINGNYDIKDSDGNSLLDNFLPPVWSNDNKLVSIYANKENLISIEKNTTKDIYFTLTKGCTTADGLPIKTEINHKYRINDQTKSEPPVISENTNATRPQIKFRNKLLSDSYSFNEGAVPSSNDGNFYVQNHTNSKLDFYVEGRDFGGGKIYAYITYKLVYNSDGTRGKNVEKELVFDKYEDTLLDQNEASGNKYTNISYDMAKLQDYKDGLYEFTVRVQDEYNNISETGKHYYVICDTQLSKSSNAMFWFEAPMFRQDWKVDKELAYPSPYDQQVATQNLMEKYRKQIQFSYLVDDVYYITPDSTQYIDKVEDLTYLISWGSSLDNLCEPVEMTATPYPKSADYYKQFDEYNKNKDADEIVPTAKPDLVPSENSYTVQVNENGVTVTKTYYYPTYLSWLDQYYYNNFGGGDPNTIYSPSMIKYDLPEQYYSYSLAHQDIDIYLQATIIDSVGNTNTIESVIPKAPQVYSYTVKDKDGSAGKKIITINYSDSTVNCSRFTNVPNKQVEAFFRVFYAQTNSKDADTSNLGLTRNTWYEFKDDNWSSFTDENEFEIDYDETKQYVVVYLQPNYQTHSLVNDAYTGQTFGPYVKLVIDSSVNTSTEGGPADFTISKIDRESAGANTGLLNITLTLSAYDAQATYIPYYSRDPKINSSPDQWVAVNDCTITEDHKITFTISNPLRPPVYAGEDNNLVNKSWDECRDLLTEGYYYFEYPVDFKVLAIKDGISNESPGERLILKSQEDDNIPPKQNPMIISHDSRLDYDGKSFVFENLIKEQEGHLKSYFTFYYTTYNGVWGDNLDILTPEEIETLPGGKGYIQYNGGPWQGVFSFSYSPVVPVYGLEDGEYMFFGKFEDTQGNYSYITLGKAHIGTYKNKPVVTVNALERSIKADFTLSSGDPDLEKTYINIQSWNPWNNKWDDLYEDQNQLQKLNLQTSSSASITYDPDFKYYDRCEHDGDTPDLITSVDRNKPYQWQFYRITVQGFNMHPHTKGTNYGVSIDYGRPYIDVDGQPVANVFHHAETYNNQTEYDLCTEETVSYTTYVYLPGTWEENVNGQTVTKVENLSDIRSSFSTSDAEIISNKKYIVNVLCSPVDLGSSIDEWERRGKLIRTHYYEPDQHPFKDEQHIVPNENYHEEFDSSIHPFNMSLALQDLFNSHETGQLYYAAVVYFADGSNAISDVKSAVLF